MCQQDTKGLNPKAGVFWPLNVISWQWNIDGQFYTEPDVDVPVSWVIITGTLGGLILDILCRIFLPPAVLNTI